jgi:hypothetical protein
LALFTRKELDMTDQKDQQEKRPLFQERLQTLEEEQLEGVTGRGGSSTAIKEGQ